MIREIISVGLIFTCGTFYLYFIASKVPQNKSGEYPSLYFPNNLSQLKSLSSVLKLYYEENWEYVLHLFCSAYLYKQAFMIPGSALLNILGGAIFGLKLALPLCCILTACGATLSYLISRTFGKPVIEKFWHQKLVLLRAQAAAKEKDIFSYLLFLRMFPMSPNWLINIMCPHIGVPLNKFFPTVLLGLIPYNFVCVQAGEMITSISSLDEIFTVKVFIQLAAVAFASLGPTWYFKGR